MLSGKHERLLKKLLKLKISESLWIESEYVAEFINGLKMDGDELYNRLMVLEGKELIEVRYGYENGMPHDIGAIKVFPAAYTYFSEKKALNKERRKSWVVGFVSGIIASIIASGLYSRFFE